MTDIDNGKTVLAKKNTKQVEIEIPEAMQGGDRVALMIQEFKKDEKASNVVGGELSKYMVTEGMQNKDKLAFFTEFKDNDDVLRMNTIEAFNNVSLLCIRKTADRNIKRIMQLNKDIYELHTNTHRINMVSLMRKREEAYVKILSSDSSDSGVVPTGIKKFFGIGGKK